MQTNCDIFSSEYKSHAKLKEIHAQAQVPDHKLVQEVDTRWNFTFHMFERMIEQHKAVTTTLCFLNRKIYASITQIWNCLKRQWVF